MYPILFKFEFITMYSYGAMVALAFLAGISLAIYLLQREGLFNNRSLDLAIVVMVASIVGARIFYVIEFFDFFRAHPWEILMVWNGGLVFYGGLTFAVLGAVVYIKTQRLPLWQYLDCMAPPTVLGYAIGRVGCFLNGCCYGGEANVPWAVHFPQVTGLHHPTQLYASTAALAAFAILLFILRRKKYDGQVFGLTLLYYCAYRFAIEFVRVNPRYLFGLSAAQWISILGMVVAAVILLALRKKK